MSPVPIAVFGALGRMGRRVVALSTEHSCRVVAALVEPEDSNVGRLLKDCVQQADPALTTVLSDDYSADLKGARVVVDFALGTGLEQRLGAAVTNSAAFICGTTGIGAAEQELLDQAAKNIPVLWAPNMSQGVTALLGLLQAAARSLPDFEVEIHEIHHHHKADAPSGTAIALANQACQARDLSPDTTLQLNRNSQSPARSPQEIGVVASRGGDTVGEHTVFLFGQGERLELTHRAQNRDIFVHGALRAVHFVRGKQPGRYSMAQVLGL